MVNCVLGRTPNFAPGRSRGKLNFQAYALYLARANSYQVFHMPLGILEKGTLLLQLGLTERPEA